MKKEEIYELVDLFSKNKLTRLNIQTTDFQIEIEKQHEISSNNLLNETENKKLIANNIKTKEVKKLKEIEEIEEKANNEYFKLESPMVGVFYERLSPELDPLVKVGDSVEEGDVVCVMEAMKMINEISSPVSGIIKKINFEDGSLVQYGDILMEIEEYV